jgi:hypothetical protein
MAYVICLIDIMYISLISFCLYLLPRVFFSFLCEIVQFQAVIHTSPKHVISGVSPVCHSSHVPLAVRNIRVACCPAGTMDRCNIAAFVGSPFGVLDRCMQVCGLNLPSIVVCRSAYTLLWQKYLKTLSRVCFLSVMVRCSYLTGTS